MSVVPIKHIDIRFSVSLDDTLEACAVYAQYRRWSARESLRRLIAANAITAISLTVQLCAALLFCYVLWAHLAYGRHLTPHQKWASSWIGSFGFVGGYFGLVPIMQRAQLKRSVQRALRRSDVDLFTGERAMHLRIDDKRVVLQSGGRHAKFPRSDVRIRLAETAAMQVLMVGAVVIPLRQDKINPGDFAAIRYIAEIPRPSPIYFSRLRRIENIQMISGILILALNFWLFVELR